MKCTDYEVESPENVISTEEELVYRQLPESLGVISTEERKKGKS